jgi:hypothetical protein
MPHLYLLHHLEIDLWHAPATEAPSWSNALLSAAWP